MNYLTLRFLFGLLNGVVGVGALLLVLFSQLMLKPSEWVFVVFAFLLISLGLGGKTYLKAKYASLISNNFTPSRKMRGIGIAMVAGGILLMVPTCIKLLSGLPIVANGLAEGSFHPMLWIKILLSLSAMLAPAMILLLSGVKTHRRHQLSISMELC